MMGESVQNELGYFGKLPTLGDFVHQVLPRDFTESWHAWLQLSMAEARTRLGDGFLACYLNCPAWKFFMMPGVCGAQGVLGLTVPSVDKVGRYFNFTLATVLPSNSDAFSYVMNNREAMSALEVLALDLLENDYPRDEIELKVRDVSLLFKPTHSARHETETAADFIRISHDQSLPFMDQVGALLNHTISQNLGNFSVWWYGQVGQTSSQLVVCRGMPLPDVYLRLLTHDMPQEMDEGSCGIVDRIISGDVSP
jgi:type VI secretion system protein ImpM